MLTFRALPTAAEMISSAMPRSDVMRELSARGLSLRAVGRLMGLHHHSVARALRTGRVERPCACCGVMFSPRNPGHKFHSVQCKWKCAKKTPWKHRPDVEVEKECQHCGEVFTKLRSSHRRVCASCRNNVKPVVPKTERKVISAFSIGWMPEGM